MKDAKRLTASIIVSMFVFLMGIFGAALQGIGNLMVAGFGFDQTAVGVFISAPAAGCLLMSIFGGTLSDRIGKRLANAIFVSVMILGLVIVILSKSFIMTVVGVFVAGMGSGAGETTCYAILTDLNPRRITLWMSLSQVLFGVGSVIAPLGAVWLVTEGGFAYQTVFLIIVIASALFLPFFFTGKKEEAHATVPIKLLPFDLLKTPRLKVYVVMVFLYIGFEMVLPAYSKQLMLSRGLGEEAATLAISVFWIASITTRFSGIFLSGRESMALKLFPPLHLIGAAVMLLFPSALAGYIGIALCGFACGPLWSLLFSLAGTLVPERSGSVCSLMVIFAGSGQMISPLLIGNLPGNAAVTVLLSGVIAAIFWAVALLSPAFRINKAQ